MTMNSEVEDKQYNVWESTSREEEVDQFQLLEEKVDRLIQKAVALKGEKEALEERLRLRRKRPRIWKRKSRDCVQGEMTPKRKLCPSLKKWNRSPVNLSF